MIKTAMILLGVLFIGLPEFWVAPAAYGQQQARPQNRGPSNVRRRPRQPRQVACPDRRVPRRFQVNSCLVVQNDGSQAAVPCRCCPEWVRLPPRQRPSCIEPYDLNIEGPDPVLENL